MRDERLGSYSIVTTFAGIPVLLRLKSMSRSRRLCPPPRKRLVRSPALRRPPVRSLGEVSGLCGRSVVRSSLTMVVLKRSVSVLGLYVLIAICHSSSSETTFSSGTTLGTPNSQELQIPELRHCRYRFCAYSGIF